MPAFRNLADGEVAYVQGSAREPYQIKNVHGVYSCSCPAWRNQHLHPDMRTCKHIKALRGVAAELARLGQQVAVQVAPAAVAAPVAVSAARRSVARVSRSAAPVAVGVAGDLPCLLAEKWTPDIERPSWEL